MNNTTHRRIETLSKHIRFEQTPTSHFSTATLQTEATSSSSSNKKMKAPVRVVVTGAAGQISYSLLPMIAQGLMFGSDQPVILQLLEIPPALKALNGVVMELTDGAFPLLAGVVATTDAEVAFADADYAILVGAFPRKEGMERAELLKRNAAIFQVQGQAINKVAKRSIKVLVVGNPANTNCMICKHFAPDVPAENFSALTRLDHNRAKAQISQRLKVPVYDVHNVIIWGNHSSTQYPDVNQGHVIVGGKKTSIREAVNDNTYLNGEYISTVQKRGAAIIEARGLSSALSASQAIVDHMRDWAKGTPEGEYVSMAVASDGSYGIKEGVYYSYPVTCKDGKYTIVQGMNIDEFSRQKMDATAAELFSERTAALEILK